MTNKQGEHSIHATIHEENTRDIVIWLYCCRDKILVLFFTHAPESGFQLYTENVVVKIIVKFW